MPTASGRGRATTPACRDDYVDPADGSDLSTRPLGMDIGLPHVDLPDYDTECAELGASGVCAAGPCKKTRRSGGGGGCSSGIAAPHDHVAHGDCDSPKHERAPAEGSGSRVMQRTGNPPAEYLVNWPFGSVGNRSKQKCVVCGKTTTVYCARCDPPVFVHRLDCAIFHSFDHWAGNAPHSTEVDEEKQKRRKAARKKTSQERSTTTPATTMLAGVHGHRGAERSSVSE
jgi:hypothetical protein